jgi:hypothetical protein
MEITNEKYQNIINMMCSEDDENKVVALTIIEQLSFKDNITKILLLKKHSTSTKELWQANAPTIWKELESLTDRGFMDANKHLTYKQVLKTITMMKVPPEEFEFYMKDFSDYLMVQVKHLGYDFVESMEIKIKYKNYEQSREPSESM